MIIYRIKSGRFKDAILNKTKRGKLDMIDTIYFWKNDRIVTHIRLEDDLDLEKLEISDTELFEYFSSLYSIALKISSSVHAGRKNEFQEPIFDKYYGLAKENKSYTTKTLVLLHNILDITELTKEDLLDMGFPFFIVYTISILKTKDNEDFDSYVERIKNDYFSCLTMERVLRYRINDLKRIQREYFDTRRDTKEIEYLSEYYKVLREKLDEFELFIDLKHIVNNKMVEE